MANRLKETRESRGFTQQQLADLVGTTKQTIGRLENGKRQLTEAWLHQLAGALSCHPGELLAEMPSNLSPQDQAILAILHKMSPAQRDQFFKIGGTFVESSDDGNNLSESA